MSAAKCLPLLLVLSGAIQAQNVLETPAAAAPAPSAAPAKTSNAAPAQPSPLLQSQIQLNRLNAEVAAELQRIQGEVQIANARRGLEEAQHGEVPAFVGSFRTPTGQFAEFRAGGALRELAVGEFLTAEWRVAEIHDDRVVLCRKGTRQCRTETPATEVAAATK